MFADCTWCLKRMGHSPTKSEGLLTLLKSFGSDLIGLYVVHIGKLSLSPTSGSDPQALERLQGHKSCDNITHGEAMLFRGLRPEAGNAGSRGDLSHILLEVLELQLRSAHVRPPKPSPKA